MLLDGQDERVVRRYEGVVTDALDDVIEPDLGGEGVAMVDDGVVIRAIPTVHCKGEVKEWSMVKVW